MRKKISQGMGVPGLPRENNVVARYQDFFLPPPPWRLTTNSCHGVDTVHVQRNNTLLCTMETCPPPPCLKAC